MKIINILKTSFKWLIALFGFLIATISIFNSYGITNKIIGSLIIIVSFLILPLTKKITQIHLKSKPLIFVLIALIIGFTITFDTESTSKWKDNLYTVTADTLLVQKSKTNKEIVSTLISGQSIRVLSEEGEWSKIKTVNKEGYVLNKHIKEKVKQEESSSSNLTNYIAFGIIIMLVIFGKKIGSNSSRPANTSGTSNKNSIANVTMKFDNYLEVFNEEGKKINGKTIFDYEKLIGFSNSFFLILERNKTIYVYDANCKKISYLTLFEDMSYHSCAGNTYSVLKGKNFLISYDINSKQVKTRSIR